MSKGDIKTQCCHVEILLFTGYQHAADWVMIVAAAVQLLCYMYHNVRAADRSYSVNNINHQGSDKPFDTGTKGTRQQQPSNAHGSWPGVACKNCSACMSSSEKAAMSYLYMHDQGVTPWYIS